MLQLIAAYQPAILSTAGQLILIKVVTCVFVLAADGADGGGAEVPRGAPFVRQPGPAARREAGPGSNDVPALLFM